MGRKSTYTPDIPGKVKSWCEEGLIEKQIAAKIGIVVSTFEEWKLKYPELKEALKSGKVKIDEGVENALLKNAMGYEYDEITTIVKNGQNGSITETKKIKKHVAGDTTAQIFWLKNRKPAEWREKSIHQFETNEPVIVKVIKGDIPFAGSESEVTDQEKK